MLKPTASKFFFMVFLIFTSFPALSQDCTEEIEAYADPQQALSFLRNSAGEASVDRHCAFSQSLLLPEELRFLVTYYYIFSQKENPAFFQTADYASLERLLYLQMGLYASTSGDYGRFTLYLLSLQHSVAPIETLPFIGTTQLAPPDDFAMTLIDCFVLYDDISLSSDEVTQQSDFNDCISGS